MRQDPSSVDSCVFGAIDCDAGDVYFLMASLNHGEQGVHAAEVGSLLNANDRQWSKMQQQSAQVSGPSSCNITFEATGQRRSRPTGELV